MTGGSRQAPTAEEIQWARETVECVLAGATPLAGSAAEDAFDAEYEEALKILYPSTDEVTTP